MLQLRQSIRRKDKEKNAFYVRSKKLIVKKQQPILVEGLAMNGYIEFQPIVILSANITASSVKLRAIGL